MGGHRGPPPGHRLAPAGGAPPDRVLAGCAAGRPGGPTTRPPGAGAQSTRAALALLAELAADQAEAVALRVLGGLEVAKLAPITGKRPGAGAGPPRAAAVGADGAAGGGGLAWRVTR